MEIVGIVIALVIGLAIGGVVGWIVRSARASGESIEQKTEIARLNGQLEQATTAQQVVESAKVQFSEAAKLTAAEALQGNNDQFLKLANENLDKALETASRELQQRHQQFQELVKPLSENYGKLNPQIDLLIEQSNKVTAETNRLSTALTDNRQAGYWGEMQLRRVIDLAGMTDYCDFSEQEALGDSAGRPDLIVRLPEHRAIVVDAKASTLAYMEANQVEDADAADAAFRRHAQAMRGQVDALGAKNYGDAVEGSLDFVVMFVPGDQFLAAALSANPGLVEYAMSKRVAIATPASLISMLWAVANGWQQFRLAQNAEEIRKLGSEMHDRLLAFLKNYGSVQQRLRQTVDAFNSSVGTLEGRVLVSARKMAEMRDIDPEVIAAPDLVETPLRSLSAVPDAEEHIAAADN